MKILLHLKLLFRWLNKCCRNPKNNNNKQKKEQKAEAERNKEKGDQGKSPQVPAKSLWNLLQDEKIPCRDDLIQLLEIVQGNVWPSFFFDKFMEKQILAVAQIFYILDLIQNSLLDTLEIYSKDIDAEEISRSISQNIYLSASEAMSRYIDENTFRSMEEDCNRELVKTCMNDLMTILLDSLYDLLDSQDLHSDDNIRLDEIDKILYNKLLKKRSRVNVLFSSINSTEIFPDYFVFHTKQIVLLFLEKLFNKYKNFNEIKEI